MLTVKKELDLQDFINDYDDIMSGWDYEAKEIIYDSLCDTMSEGAEDMTIRHYLRFQLEIQTQEDVISNYDVIDDEDLKGMDEDEMHEAVENYLNDNTYLLGSYEDNNGIMIYIFDEF
jgi:hypothetical protein